MRTRADGRYAVAVFAATQHCLPIRQPRLLKAMSPTVAQQLAFMRFFVSDCEWHVYCACSQCFVHALLI